jgi:hypothetical protein
MTSKTAGWKWGLAAAAVFVMLALWPHMSLWISRGSQWQGANALMHPDEVAYSAYVASLIEGRTRRNDPYTGRQDRADSPLAESLFSVQLLPAYAVALPARLAGVDAATAFIVFSGIAAFAAALALFWFLMSVTGNGRVGAAGVCFVLGFGTLAAGQGLVRHVLTLPYLIPLSIAKFFQSPSIYHLPFLRLYQPAVAFPLFFVELLLLWSALTSADMRRRVLSALSAGLIFAILVFSYFFLWTAAAAWVVCVAVLWLILRPSERRRSLAVFTIVGMCGMAALILYFLMLSHRSATVDAVQALVLSRRPNLFRLPEIIAALPLVIVLSSLFRRDEGTRSPHLIFAASMLLTPFVIFNQQILTGRVLQAIHYEWFIANYVVLTGLVLIASEWRTETSNWKLVDKRLLALACVALVWATAEVWLATSVAAGHNFFIDQSRAVAKRLTALNESEDAARIAVQGGTQQAVVLSTDLVMADRLPTDAPQALLWSPHMLVFPAVTVEENRERFYRQLYYSGYDKKKLWREFDRNDWNFYAGLFDYERLSPVITGDSHPITQSELADKVEGYLRYAQSFDRERAMNPMLYYMVVPADNEPDYANLDRWYQRDSGERIDKFILYRLKPR